MVAAGPAGRVSVLVGGQFGSEAKGKIAAYLASEYQLAVRTGGSNAGHTVNDGTRDHVVRHIPCTFLEPACKLALGAGTIVDLEVLQREIADHNLTPQRLVIDRQAIVVDESHRAAEAELVGRIGSTGKGVGAAIAAKVKRGTDVRLVRDEPQLKDFAGSVADEIHACLRRGERVLIEGSQGTGLSLHHGTYPFVTGRCTTAGALCAEAGVGPTVVDHVYLVVRTYPIRVAGTSGPLSNEIDWETVTRESGSPVPLHEKTTVTKKTRRVGRFDMDEVVRACELNGATNLCLTFADYLDANDRDVISFDALSSRTKDFVAKLEDTTQRPVSLISTGPATRSTIDRRPSRTA